MFLNKCAEELVLGERSLLTVCRRGGCSGPSGQYENPPPSTSFNHQMEVTCGIVQRSKSLDHNIVRSSSIGVLVRLRPRKTGLSV